MREHGTLYWVQAALSAIALVLVAVIVAFGESNRGLRADINQRQQLINQGIRLERVNEALVRSLAETAIRDHDDKVRDLLLRQGITINVTANTPAPAGAAATPAAAAPPAGKQPTASGK